MGEGWPGCVGTARPHWPEVPTMPREGLGRTGPSWRLSSGGGEGGREGEGGGEGGGEIT